MSSEASVADAISAFPSNVSPSDQDQLVLTRGELKRIIANALEGFKTEFDEFREEVNRERALDRKRIKALEVQEPQPSQKDRGKMLCALLVSNNGKMLAKEARKIMRLSKPRFSELLSVMPDQIETKTYHLDKRELVLILK